jgi:GT2 family glycosyltransferase
VKILTIIVSYNGEHFIKGCISHLNNSSVLSDILIIDNFSTDNTIKIIEKLIEDNPNLMSYKNQSNIGFGQACNLGLKYALDKEYDYVLLLNQDVYVDKNTISLLLDCMKANHNYGVISPMHLDGTKINLDKRFAQYYQRTILKNQTENMSLLNTEFVNAAIWLLSKNCIETVGGFNPCYFHYGEDDNYLERVKYHNLKIGILTTAFAVHDREENDNYFKNRELEGFKKYLTSIFSNPNVKNSISFLFIKVSIKLTLSIFTLNRLKINTNLCFLKSFFKLDYEEIHKNRKISMQKGPSFL